MQSELSKIKQALDAEEVRELHRLRAENARLLEALKDVRQNDIDHKMSNGAFRIPQNIREKIQAAIEAAEK